mgnify:CR=1 FL=1
MTQESVTITDHRTGESYDIDLVDGALPAIALRQIKTPDDDFGLMTYDPAFTNTASCRSTITYIDGDKGILEYRGYPIDELAGKSSFLEVVHLLLHGELPGADELGELAGIVGGNMAVEDSMKKFIDGFLPDAHPMGMLISSLACLSTYYPEAKDVTDPQNRMQQIHRLLGKVPTLAAYAFRRTAGLPYPDPDPALSFAGNFLKMVFADEDGSYTQDPVLEKAMDVLFTLHADHEQNCSTSTVRMAGSSHANLYATISSGISALWGPRHGGANQAVIEMLQSIQEDGAESILLGCAGMGPLDEYVKAEVNVPAWRFCMSLGMKLAAVVSGAIGKSGVEAPGFAKSIITCAPRKFGFRSRTPLPKTTQRRGCRLSHTKRCP